MTKRIVPSYYVIDEVYDEIFGIFDKNKPVYEATIYDTRDNPIDRFAAMNKAKLRNRLQQEYDIYQENIDHPQHILEKL